ncbi:unnamed protein product [Owenia fusiformis]|uniref:Uncharacterized protein n=1 Tax=Owenia fusiformis TaxID=6347 RepID=A0A8J1UN41_OWEFU|nr:unnamed protein product [Owenia fusiformis]
MALYSNEAYTGFYILVRLYFTVPMCILGIIGNTLSFTILHKMQKINTTIFLLRTLAITDILYLIAELILYPYTTIYWYTDWICDQEWAHYPMYAYPIVFATAEGLQMITTLIVVVITVERYIGICHSLRAHVCSMRNIKVWVAVCIGLGVVYSIPRAFEVVMLETPKTADAIERFLIDPLNLNRSGGIPSNCTSTNSSNITNGYYVAPEFKLYLNSSYFIVYSVLGMVFRYGGPVILVCYMNARIIAAMYKVKQYGSVPATTFPEDDRRKSMCAVQCMNNTFIKFTKMCVVVAVVFVLCMIPTSFSNIATIIRKSYKDLQSTPKWLPYYNIVIKFMLVVNSSVNFIIYCCVKPGFRMQASKLFCPAEKVKKSKEHSELIVSRDNTLRTVNVTTNYDYKGHYV